MEADSDVSAHVHVRGPGRAERVMLTGFAAFVVAVPAAVLIPGNPVP